MTLGIDKISPTHKPSDYKFWDMSSYTSPALDETAAMYFYAKCSKTGTTGSFLLSKNAYKMDPGDGYYYFLVGTLSSEYEGERSYRNVYGFTEVLPGSITTSVIASSDGQTYFNLVDGEIVAAHLTIKSGSGYNNLTDKPDLGIYATNAELSIQSNRISATVEKVNTINNTIETSGWITAADGTTIFAKKEMEGGKAIVNAINVGTDGVLIQANRINLVGAVSFSMLSDYTTVNNKINGKADASSLGDLAYQDYVYSRDLAKEITDTIAAKVSPNQLRNYAFANGDSITKGDLTSALQTEINSKLTGSSTSSGNKLASVIINGETLVAGGYIQANLINVDEIWCTNLAAVRGTIGDFTISESSIYSDRVTISSNGISFTKEDGKIYGGYGVNAAPGHFGVNVPMWIYNHQNGQDTNYGIRIDVGDASVATQETPGGPITYVKQPFNNIAISTVGAFAGLAFKTRQVTTSVTLTNSDVFVSCYNKSAITVNMPSNPTVGKVFFIADINGAGITLNGNGKSIYTDRTYSSVPSSGQGQISLMIYDGQYWKWNSIKW